MPPTGATPITSDLAPAAAAARGSMCGRPVVTLAPGVPGDIDGVLRSCAEAVAAELDHRFVLAGRPAVGRLEERGDSYALVIGDETVTLPRVDCVVLDVGNTTTEALAAWAASRVERKLTYTGYNHSHKH